MGFSKIQNSTNSGGKKPSSDNERRNGAAALPSVLESFAAKVKEKLVVVITEQVEDDQISEAALRTVVTKELNIMMTQDKLPLNPEEKEIIITEVINDTLGYGPIEVLLADPSVSEIMVNGTDSIYIEQNGKITLSDVNFRTEEHLRKVIDKIVSSIGRRIDESSPMVDARLPDGSRVNAIIGPLAVDGPALTIRKFMAEGMTAADLVEKGSLSPQALGFLRATIEGQLNMLVSGGTGTGKTTFLNILSSFIPDTDRIVTIEDAVELSLRQRHVIRLECRPPNVEGTGAIGTRELVKNSLRMRPDRIIVGECRGGEALDMLQAMNTGHEGSLTTLHSNTPRDAISRLETMVLLTGFDLPQRAIREQIASAVDMIIQLERLRDGRRVVSSITEVVGMEGEVVTLNEIYKLGHDAEGTPTIVEPLGIRPQKGEKMSKNGVEILSSWFEKDKN